jgi:hypothetical protein
MKNYNLKPKTQTNERVLLFGDVIIPEFSPADGNIHREHLDC